MHIDTYVYSKKEINIYLQINYFYFKNSYRSLELQTTRIRVKQSYGIENLSKGIYLSGSIKRL